MAFATGYQADLQKIGGGERYEDNTILTASTFEDGLQIGRFAKVDAGSLDNLDASATPVIAGVVLRDIANGVERGGVYTTELYSQVEYVRHGIVTVDAVSGQTPSMFEAIYAENQTGADYGKATLTSTGNADANAEFIGLVDGANDVWQIRLK